MKTQIRDLPEIAIIGKQGLCTEEKNIAQDLWADANSNFNQVANLGMKEADGSFVGFWGAMSDETMSFMPWTNNFSRGYYLAGIEVNRDVEAPEGWYKWVMPARQYLIVDVEMCSYMETFSEALQKIIPEMNLKLSGAVCDFTEPKTGKNKLFFPVSQK